MDMKKWQINIEPPTRWVGHPTNQPVEVEGWNVNEHLQEKWANITLKTGRARRFNVSVTIKNAVQVGDLTGQQLLSPHFRVHIIIILSNCAVLLHVLQLRGYRDIHTRFNASEHMFSLATGTTNGSEDVQIRDWHDPDPSAEPPTSSRPQQGTCSTDVIKSGASTVGVVFF
ncbi:hypothetical protein BC835DRAFT_1311368 [Cytidiella melzeri]|nr:hypothetical protein BC835DRAFT_1311368 [Cytidiella melzeri]